MFPRGTTIVGRYRIDAPEGQGGMGTVYRAVDLRLGGKRWAVKVLTLTDPDAAQSFLQEAQLLARLEHPNLPAVGDHGMAQDESFQFLVMQYIDGLDLGTWLQRKQEPFALDRVLPWANQLLEVLTYLHTQQPQIIHRDIKPANIKLTPQGRIVLLDFGIAKTMDLATQQTAGRAARPQRPRRPQDSIKMGTPHFSSPEQSIGASTNARSDLYSLGATLYTLLTGRPPADATRRLHARAQGKPDPLIPAHLNGAAIPSAISSVLAQAMALVPAQRFADAAAMKRALERASAQRPAQRPAQPSAQRPAQRPAAPLRRPSAQPPTSVSALVDWRTLVGSQPRAAEGQPLHPVALWVASALMALVLALIMQLG